MSPVELSLPWEGLDAAGGQVEVWGSVGTGASPPLGAPYCPPAPSWLPVSGHPSCNPW